MDHGDTTSSFISVILFELMTTGQISDILYQFKNNRSFCKNVFAVFAKFFKISDHYTQKILIGLWLAINDNLLKNQFIFKKIPKSAILN